MKRIGVDLEKLIEGKPFPADWVPDCPGASVRITRKDFDDMVKGGESFRTERSELPGDGYGTARIRCSQPVQKLLTTQAGHQQFYGLCFSCSGVEARNREVLRARQGKGAKNDDREAAE